MRTTGIDFMRSAASKRNRSRRSALTLVELIAVLAAGGLLLGVVTPALQAARRQSHDTVCLNNLQALGGAIHTYASEYDGRLPGPLHPAVNHDQQASRYLSMGYSPTQTAYNLRRQTLPLLGSVLGDSINERLVTCPVLAGVVTWRHVESVNAATNKSIFKFHYALNNYGNELADSGGGLDIAARETQPPGYFGHATPLGAPPQYARKPVIVGQIPRAADEWMVADAWFRTRNTGSHPVLALFKQEGPYQSQWSGDALPFWAPHGRPARPLPTDANERAGLAAQAGSAQRDGWTNSVFIDGHAAAVPSRRLHMQGAQIIYGFPGTVNPNTASLTPDQLALLSQFQWE